jgi:Rrf2 family transcriptional regulator, iron-sulfur cluster assembly transcription factor
MEKCAIFTKRNHYMFSKACEHGIKALIYIATQSMEGKRAKTGDIANHSGTPEAFTAKVLGKLSGAGILDSVKGPYGGFFISNKQMQSITLSHVVDAIDGNSIFTACGLGLKECNDANPCPMHHKFLIVRSELKKMLISTTLQELAEGIKSGNTLLNPDFTTCKSNKNEYYRYSDDRRH